MKLVIGLGNPGKKYEATRHNIGFMVVDELARRHHIDVHQERFNAWFGTGRIDQHNVALAKPTTFMNCSGTAVQNICSFYKLDLADLLVVVDDLALPTGKLRIRPDGSAGGQKGLADISRMMGTQTYPRLRIGIGAAAYNAVDHVLGRFEDSERPAIRAAVRRAADAVTYWLSEGTAATMNQYNRDLTQPQNKKKEQDDNPEEHH